MRRFVTLFLLLLAVSALQAAERKMIPRYNKITRSWASYPAVSIREIQQVPYDSLVVADNIQNNTARWKLQTSPYNITTDTVVVTALCVVPGKVITYTQHGFTMLIYDTASTALWGGLLVRCSSDTAKHILDGFLNVEAGDIVQMTGVVSEFPTSSMNSTTQFQPVPGISIDLVGSMAIPPPVPLTVGDFYNGIFSSGKVRYSTGEPYEGMIVQLTNLLIDAKVNLTRGTFSAYDPDGNEITEYDASRFFTLKGTSIDHPYPDTQWTRIYGQANFVGTQIDTMRGFITTSSGAENARGYRICPLNYGDIVFGVVRPSITTHRRYPVLVPSDSTPLVTVKATSQTASALASVVLYYSLDGGPFTADSMTLNLTDSTYRANIPQEPANTMVRYYVKAVVDSARTSILASAASGGSSADTNRGYFFYTVTDQPYTIHDIQYTPFLNGRSAYVGGVVTVAGVVTSDTANMYTVAGNTGWTNAWYMQTGNQPWDGIWIVGPDSVMDKIRNGDSVSVTGTVAENFDVTRIQNITSATVLSSGNPVPDPVPLTTGVFGANAGNGNPGAEPYEGMLARFTRVVVTNINPTFSDASEYEVDDGSGPVLVQHGGKNKYSNVASDTLLGKTIIHQGDTIATLTGVVYFSFNRYKFVPRTDADFGSITTDVITRNGVIPASYSLGQNYPNPFNPTTNFVVSLPQATHLRVEVFNLLGQKVTTLANEERPAGSYTITWKGTTQDGRPVTSGVYFVRMETPKFNSVRKLMLMK